MNSPFLLAHEEWRSALPLAEGRIRSKAVNLPLNSPDLIKASDAQLIAATTNGKGKMPAYATKLTAAQIKDTITYIRTLQK